jgi:hypothetical protein
MNWHRWQTFWFERLAKLGRKSNELGPALGNPIEVPHLSSFESRDPIKADKTSAIDRYTYNTFHDDLVDGARDKAGHILCVTKDEGERR